MTTELPATEPASDAPDLETREAWECVSCGVRSPLHEAFAPTRQEIDRALRIVEAFRDAERRGLGVVSLGSKMIDPPVVQRALKRVEQARVLGLIPDESGDAEEQDR